MGVITYCTTLRDFRVSCAKAEEGRHDPRRPSQAALSGKRVLLGQYMWRMRMGVSLTVEREDTRLGMPTSTCQHPAALPFSCLLLHFWWIFLQQLCDGFVDVLLLLFWLGFRVNGFGRGASPDKILFRAFIHVEVQLPDIDR
jgi:hypothetical protein